MRFDYLFYFCDANVTKKIHIHIMKKVLIAFLVIAVAGLLYINYRSIQGKIEFDETVIVREDAVKSRLLQIKDVEEQWKLQDPQGAFCDNWDLLTDFALNGRIPKVIKEGELSDKQLEDGLTDSLAAAIVNAVPRDEALIAEKGLQGYRRDTIWVNVKDSMLTLHPDFVADSLRYIPFAEGDTFELAVQLIQTRSGVIQFAMECGAHFDSYLKNMGREGDRLISNRKKQAEELFNYDGLKIGDLYNWNNNAGNWE